MRKKYRRLRKRENIIVFPGTYEKLVREGIQFVENEDYKQAVKLFEQAMDLEPESLEFLAPYAIALYEVKDFKRAKEITKRHLHNGPADYLGTMELYLTILIQLEEYEDVAIEIDVLLSEGFVPKELINKFTYLQALNHRLASRYSIDDTPVADPVFTLDEFLAMDIGKQQQMLASLEGTDLRVVRDVLEDIVESVNLSPFIVTLGLSLLYQLGSEDKLTIRKFGLERIVVPKFMMMPGEDPIVREVLEELDELLSQDPSRLELAKSLVEKFAILAYPFDWGDYTVQEIALAYVSYIESLFSGENMPETQLHAFIKQLDASTDFDNM